jgi:stage II sporulation protein M
MTYRKWIVVAAVLFSLGIILGVYLSLSPSAEATEELAIDLTALEDILNLFIDLPAPLLAAVIFLNNVFTLVTNYLLSPLLCLFPVLALILNGCILGIIAPPVAAETSFGYMLALLLPHGVIEIPAFIMGEAAALSAGMAVMLAVFKKERRGELVPHLKKTLKYLAIAVALLIPAAIIEVYVTMPLINQGG